MVVVAVLDVLMVGVEVEDDDHLQEEEEELVVSKVVEVEHVL